MKKLLLSTAVLIMFLLFNQTIAQTSNTTLEDSTVHRPWYELGMMADPILDQALLFYLSMTYSRQADIGECLQTASRINPTDTDSWAREWTVTAERLQLLAANAERDGFTVSAGELYMRSATYFSAALHRQNNPEDPMVFENTQSASVCFRKALELLDIPATPVQIPYENTTLPGYFFRSPLAKGKAPVLIVQEGRDGWALHCKYIADAAILRGYHCLLVDGPGQGEALRLQGLVFRPDWEKVITPIVDYLITQKDVDPDRIGLLGLSMGGALAPRAVAFEKRIKVCVANPGVLSWSDIIYGFFGEIDPALATLWQSNPGEFNTRIAEIAAQVPLIDWGIRDMMWKHDAKSPADLMVQFQDYSNREFVSNITCKMLVMDGAADDYSQGKDLYDALTCPKEYMLFDIDDPGLQHCQVGAQASSSERLFDWLDKNL
jgi:pimeloyl-ACP methyl ester carboxylesterase